MMRQRFLGTRALAFVAVSLSAVLVLLVVKSNSSDFDFTAASLVVRELKQVDAQWNVDVLNVNAGLNNNFDKVVAPLPEIRRLSERLHGLTASYARLQPEAGAELARLLDRYSDTMEQKIRSVEHVKSSHAILANSARYLPAAHDLLVGSARAARLPPQEMAALERQLNEVLSAVVGDLTAPDTGANGTVQAAANSIRARLPAWPEPVAESARGLLSHVDVVLRQRESNKQGLLQLAALPTVAQLDALHDRYIKELERDVRVQSWYRYALIAYSMVLLVMLAFAAWRLYRHHRSLNASNAQLKEHASEAQLLLIQSAKMSAIGQMVAGIAHEINTPLAYVKATFSVLRELLLTALRDTPHTAFGQRLSQPTENREALIDAHEEDGTAKSLMDDISSLVDDGLHGIEQISELILTLKNFSRIDRAKRSDVALAEGLNSALTIARYMLKGTVDIKKEYQDVPKVHCSPSQINQVFLNLITNAAQAMSGRSEKGTIILRTSRHGDDMVRVDIQDNGCGIPKEFLPRIFDPLFTTKPAGKGTGLGLYNVMSVVSKMNGHIAVDSTVGKGTAFKIEFSPASQPIQFTAP